MTTTAVLNAIDAIYAAALEPERWPEALDKIAQAVGGVGTVIVPVTSPREMMAVSSTSLLEPNLEYQNTWWRHDRRIEYSRNRRYKSRIVTDSDLLTEEQIRRDPFYQEFLRRYGLGACMAQVLSPASGYVMAVSVQRDLRRGGFDGQETDSFGLIGRHAALALTTTARLAEAHRTSRLLDTVMQHAGAGIIVVSGGGRVSFVNEAGQALLGDGLSIRDGRLVARTADEQKRLDALIGHCVSDRERRAKTASPVTVAVSRERSPLPLLVQAIPVHSPPQSADWEEVVLGPGALVLIHDPAVTGGPDITERFVLLGLTPGQAKVADAMSGGLSVAEAAGQLGLAEGTIRAVLKSVYDKLGVSRQSQLAIIATKLRAMG